MNTLDLAVIGNCTFGALIDERARVVWSCMPRFDSDPQFCSILDAEDTERGFYAVELCDFERSEQRYRRNSAVVETTLYDAHGGAVRVTDFAPRFKQYGRVFRPGAIVRIVEPLAGRPRVRLKVRPSCDHGAGTPQVTRGSNHVRYVMADQTLRLTTDAPVTYVTEETAFGLGRPITMVFGPDESLAAPVEQVGRDFLMKTDAYWREWARYLSIPFEWQDAVIRASITLKLCSFEDTGAIIAAMTTSIPESADSGRNWDYRFCWLRDSYFVVHALNRLGVTRTMEGYLDYIANIVAENSDFADGGHLQPVFSIGMESELTESELEHLPGYRSMGPVRLGNGAYTQIQNDGYGSVILASAQSFFDERLDHPGDADLFERLEPLGERAIQLWDQPDAGLWELRTRQEVHTYSAVMCWAGCDRLARIAERLGLNERAAYWRENADAMREGILDKAWNAEMNSMVSTFGGTDLDASLLCLQEVGFLDGRDPRFIGTLEQVETHLKHGDFIRRYAVADDFGAPDVAFNVCTFWYIDALTAAGRTDEARALFEKMLAARNSLGLLSEDMTTDTRELWGNFPQTYSMVGLINSAIRLSKTWEEAF